jgi:hypothetical protein
MLLDILPGVHLKKIITAVDTVGKKTKIPALFRTGTLHILYRHLLKMLAPNTSDSTKSTKKIKNKTFAIEAAPSAIPPNPKMAATIAMIRNVTVQRNIER